MKQLNKISIQYIGECGAKRTCGTKGTCSCSCKTKNGQNIIFGRQLKLRAKRIYKKNGQYGFSCFWGYHYFIVFFNNRHKWFNNRLNSKSEINSVDKSNPITPFFARNIPNVATKLHNIAFLSRKSLMATYFMFYNRQSFLIENDIISTPFRCKST